jgi:hypothetical protein
MALYLISYDINEKDAFEYDGLWAKLKELGAARILYSEWVLNDECRQSIRHLRRNRTANSTERQVACSRDDERCHLGQAFDLERYFSRVVGGSERLN